MQGENTWIVISRKSKNVARHHKIKKGKSAYEVSNIKLDKQRAANIEEIVHKSEIVKQIMTCLYKYIKQINLKKQQDALDQKPKISIDILGIGNFIQYKKPYIQFLLIKEIILRLISETELISVNAFDPVFTPQCQAQLCKVFQRTTFLPLGNKKKTNNNEIRFYYMIHCEKQLYAEVLDLEQQNIVVIGNSLKQYNMRSELIGRPKIKSFEDQGIYEQKLCDLEEAFNDTYFISRKLDKLPIQ